VKAFNPNDALAELLVAGTSGILVATVAVSFLGAFLGGFLGGSMTAARVAIDLGAESGRVIVGVLSGGRMRLEEVHRFGHVPVWLPTGLHWDITGTWREIVAGLRKAVAWARANGCDIQSIGVDAWGVDWALVDKSGELVGLPHAYRDPRNPAAFERVLGQLGAERIYRATGIQLMAINSLFSLYAERLASPEAFAAADRLLFLPDLFHYWLSGNRTTEATIASTSQMVDCHTGDWSREMLAELGLPTQILGPIVPPGTVVGTLRAKIAGEIGLDDAAAANVQVITPAAHDTASAVAAVPAGAGANWCYLSSGTWSLLGAELAKPCVSEAAQEAMFTNELGIGGTTRFLKNIPGLWLVQECRRELGRRGQDADYAELAREAAASKAFRTLANPLDASFQTPGDILAKIAEVTRATGQPIPESAGEFVRCCLESLAFTYRDKLAVMEKILGRKFDVIHVVGGGGKNALLAQMTADATGRRVVVGPYEATALGNVLVQSMAAGEVADLGELRQIVGRSVDLVTYAPADGGGWNAAYPRFQSLG
jgi:rhamnulokinase